jgi:hypothetical protein
LSKSKNDARSGAESGVGLETTEDLENKSGFERKKRAERRREMLFNLLNFIEKLGDWRTWLIRRKSSAAG